MTEAVHTLNMKIFLEKSGESQSWNWRHLFDKPDRPSLNSTKSAFRNSMSPENQSGMKQKPLQALCVSVAQGVVIPRINGDICCHNTYTYTYKAIKDEGRVAQVVVSWLAANEDFFNF